MDNVNHPYHYDGSTSIECIEAMETMFGRAMAYDFCVCNAFKYIWRHRNKNGLEDLNKAQWYLNKAKEYSDIFMPSEQIAMTILFPEYRPYHETLQILLNRKKAQWQESHPISDSTSSTP